MRSTINCSFVHTYRVILSDPEQSEGESKNPFSCKKCGSFDFVKQILENSLYFAQDDIVRYYFR